MLCVCGFLTNIIHQTIHDFGKEWENVIDAIYLYHRQHTRRYFQQNMMN